jgi:density-regulated protein DRP1
VIVTLTSRSKKKFVTSVVGLDGFNVDLKEAAKVFGKRFACGASVVRTAPGMPDSIDIQGDFADDVSELIEERFEVPEDCISFVDKRK